MSRESDREKSEKVIDTFRAVRQFQRFLNLDSNGFSLNRSHVCSHTQGGKKIADIIYNFDEGTVTSIRVNEKSQT